MKNAGLLAGAHHFGQPSTVANSAQQQASFFYNNGGKWTADGKTLPGALLIQEKPGTAVGGPGSPFCWGMTAPQMTQWIFNFMSALKNLYGGKKPVLYTDLRFWKACTNNWWGMGANGFNAPIMIANAQAGLTANPPLPTGYTHYTFWVYQINAPVNGVSKPTYKVYYDGTLAQLKSWTVTKP